jgi:flagellar hook-associated protein 1 FlgK
MLHSLNVAQSGLIASKTNVENVMNNIANENTDGYKKRVVSVMESAHNDARLTGRGVDTIDTNRITNIYMYDNLMGERSKNAEYDELTTMLADIESLFYETETSGFSTDLDKYFQSLEDLRSNPYSQIYKTNLINQGNILVDNLQSIYNKIEDRENISQNFLDDHVAEVNGILSDIGNINREIENAIIPSNDLLDTRDRLEYQLSEFFEIEIDRGDYYSLSISDITAVRYNTNIHEIRIIEDDVAQKDIYADVNNNSTLFSNSTFNEVGDTITYSFNKDHKITVEYGETVNGLVVDGTNVVQSLIYKINNDSHMSNFVEAFNGQYSLDEYGNKILHAPTDVDHYLIIEAKDSGLKGEFTGEILIDDVSDGRYYELKSDLKSIEAQNDVHLEVFDKEIPLESGKIKSIIDNLDSNSGANKFERYKDMLDNFAKKLSDVSQSYIFLGENEYVYGEHDSNIHADASKAKTLGLFEGSSVKTLEFNDSAVGKLTQEDLDYLATIHWNEDFEFEEGSGDVTSFNKYFQNIRVQVSADKENVDYLATTQEAVTESLQLTYDKLVKVDKDEEMVNLIKYQAAYEANAKLITVVDEMLATILGIKS